MFTLFRFFGFDSEILKFVLNLFLIYSVQWIKFNNHTLIQMTMFLKFAYSSQGNSYMKLYII